MPTRTTQEMLDGTGYALGLIALAALSSPVSQLTLAPVYGSIPASINHSTALPLTFIFGSVLHASIAPKTRNSRIRSWLPFMAACIPAAEVLALLLSDHLGIVAGPVLAGMVSCHSIVIACAFAAAEVMDGLDIPGIAGIPSTVIGASIALLPLILLERFFAIQLPEILTRSRLIVPADMQLIMSAALVLLCGPGPVSVVSTWTLLVATYVINPYGNGPYARQVLDNSLKMHDWTLLDRQWSTTGYVSVLEDKIQQYRVLRCDHSLLGGEWLLNNERRSQQWSANEPIYSVFTMLEAVRLIEDGPKASDAEAKALVIGLGIGTAPKALLQHGIDTTIVELDPVVYDYAGRYFDLPRNHTAILQDATSWTRAQALKDDFERPHFDYIIHDVFTGGAEPLSLFTTTFLQDLRALLRSDGVAAINYAGDLSMPLTTTVLNTIDLAFDRQCEVYSDDAARPDGDENFSNFIVFCRNAPGKLAFRRPGSADYLGSMSRRNYLLPKPEHRINKTWLDVKNMTLAPKDIPKWRKAQEASAKRHWQIMRTVLPARVWELY